MELADSSSLQEMVDELSLRLKSERTINSVRLQCRKLQVKFRDTRKENRGRLPEWTEEKRHEAMTLIKTHTAAEAAERMGVSLGSLRWAISYYGLGRACRAPMNDAHRAKLSEPRVWDNERKEEARLLLQEYSVAEVAEYFGLSPLGMAKASSVHGLGAGKNRPQKESTKRKKSLALQAKWAEKYPPEGPWVCFRCEVEKPVSEFKPNQKCGHVCGRCLRSDRLMKAYGITVDEYDQILAEQDGRCAICKSDDPRNSYGSFAQDHNHACCPDRKTCGKCRRGLLCARCNNVLEVFERETFDVPAFLEYLKTYASILQT